MMFQRRYFYSSKLRLIVSLKPLTIITKHSIFDVEAALDPPLIVSRYGGNSAELNALGFYIKKLKLHEVKLTT